MKHTKSADLSEYYILGLTLLQLLSSLALIGVILAVILHFATK